MFQYVYASDMKEETGRGDAVALAALLGSLPSVRAYITVAGGDAGRVMLELYTRDGKRVIYVGYLCSF